MANSISKRVNKSAQFSRFLANSDLSSGFLATEYSGSGLFECTYVFENGNVAAVKTSPILKSDKSEQF